MTAHDHILDLARRHTVDPQLAARILGLELVAVEQVTRFRREYQLGANALYSDATAIVGGVDGTWRVIDLVPRDLPFTALATRLADAPYEQRPLIKHTDTGPILDGLEHRFAVSAGELLVVTRGSHVERVTLSSERTLSPAAPSLTLQICGISVLR